MKGHISTGYASPAMLGNRAGYRLMNWGSLALTMALTGAALWALFAWARHDMRRLAEIERAERDEMLAKFGLEARRRD